MRKFTCFTLGLLLACAVTVNAQEQKNDQEGYKFTDIKRLPTTSVKSQDRAGTCWSWSTISFLESEIMRMGKDSLSLSPMYVVWNTYHAKGDKYVRMNGHVNFGQGGASADVTWAIRNYGIVPLSLYSGLNYGEEVHVHGELDAILKGYLDAVVSNPNKKLSTAWLRGYDGILNAYLGEKPENGEVGGMSVVAGADDLIDYCKSASLDEVIVAVADTQSKEMKHVLETLAEMGLTIHYRIPVPELSGASQKALTQFGRFYTITYANRFVPVGQLAMKRLLDLVGALVGCVFLGILTVIVGPMIKLESPGPIFFAQKRVGRNGRIFKMYKFRSMYADAEERKKELMAQNEMNGLMFKMENDPRITKVGAFLRKTSLDEFPQFINILKGDMSLVGTRPPTLDEFAQYSPYHKKRLSFRPGLTGMWQGSGRSDITDFEEIVKLDVEYIDNWSFWLDIKILLKTFLEVFTQKGAR